MLNLPIEHKPSLATLVILWYGSFLRDKKGDIRRGPQKMKMTQNVQARQRSDYCPLGAISFWGRGNRWSTKRLGLKKIELKRIWEPKKI